MGNVFGKKKTTKELLKENKRMLNRAIRELEKERTNLQRNEKKLISDIKKAAADGQMKSVNIMAKDLVRTRNYIQKFYEQKSQLQGVGLRLQTAQSTEAMMTAMKGTTKALAVMTKQMNLPKLQEIMREFAETNEIAEMQQEMMADTMDDALEEDGDEEETNQIVSQILDEIGVNMNDALPSANKTPVAADDTPIAAGEKAEEGVSDLEARLNNLRR